MGLTQQGGGAPRPKFFPAGLNVAAKPCDYCKSAAALLFCRAESAFMCIACDAKVHDVNDSLACVKHERVWMCEVCEQAPATVTCKADAAALCVTCDRDIHSANPLASRHERVPVVPFYDTAESVVMKSSAATTLLVHAAESDTSLFTAPPGGGHDRKLDADMAQSGYIHDSWMSTSPIVAAKIPADAPDLKSMELFFQDSDQFLDFDNYQISSQPYSDSVVPVQTTVKPPFPARMTHDQSSENRFEIDFSRSNINSYNSSSFTTPSSLSHSVSSSSMDVGVVPDGSSLSEISYNFGRNIGSTGNQGSQVVGLDREARVLRYKEKRKNRKFEKTIRYASRKAYAETRPRIKGRFAKRTDSESDIDRIFGAGAANFIADARFGIVPSF